MTRQRYFETALSLFISVWVLLLTFYILFGRPFPGFDFSNNNGVVSQVYSPSTNGQTLQVGDRIRTIDEAKLQETFSGWDLTPPLFSGLNPGDPIALVVERDGKTIEIVQPYLGPNWPEFLSRFSGQWLIPILFWLAGVMTLLFIRPRTQVSFLMALFFYLTAFWISCGIISTGHVVWAALWMRMAIWLTIPVYWHFLWHFPTPLGRLSRPALGAVYALGVILAAIQAANILPSTLYLLGFVLALAGSLLLIVLHFVRFRSERRNLAGLLIAVVIILIPIIATGMALSLQPTSSFGIVAVTGFSALPGYFFFVLFRRQVAAQIRLVNRWMRAYLIIIVVEVIVSFIPVLVYEIGVNLDFTWTKLITTSLVLITLLTGFTPFLILPALARAEVVVSTAGEHPVVIRANRLAGDVFLFLLLGFAAILLFLGLNALLPVVWHELTAILLGLSLAVFAVLARVHFQKFFQEKVLGMPMHPDRLVKEFSSRILTSLEGSELQHLLVDQVLPSLLVRQSALLRLPPGGGVQPFLALRVSPEQLPAADQAAGLAGPANRVLNAEHLPEPLEWIRVVIPLRMGNLVTGLWLFGARDPDDLYTVDDIETLESLAGQTALALSHIDQANNLRALYLADGSQREAERLEYAAELHDAVLNPLAAFRNGTYGDQIPPQLDGMLQDTIQHVRRVVKGLRPEMLTYGLPLGLQSLVDDLEENIPADGPTLSLEMPPSDARLDPQVELNLFRIVQQACQNAIRHAGASMIRVTGTIDSDQVNLCVEDDGKGFDFQGQTDLAGLLAQQHFGLAGMHERAGVIGAHLSIDSQPLQGCRLKLAWVKK